MIASAITARARRIFGVERGLLCLLVCFALALPAWTPRLYAVDSVQYFAYLPSLVQDGDLLFTNEYTALDRLNPNAGIANALLERRDLLTGRPINVAPIGTAVLWSPWYLAVHGWLLLTDPARADGVGQPYTWIVSLASLVYALAGLVLCYHIVRRWASQWAAAGAVLLCWLATPVVFYSYISPPWSHAPGLFATALFVWWWLRLRDAPTTGRWLGLGVIAGLMVLCREQLGLWLLLPAVEALVDYGRALRRGDWRTVRRLLGWHVGFVAVFALTLLPQLLAYRAMNGRWGPSTHVGGKLRWYSPNFWRTLFNLEHGAFWWTPVWCIGLLGMALLWRRDRRVMALLVLGVVAQVYINGSLDTTWHLTASFGFRRLIEATPVFALGLALLLDRVRLPRPLLALAGALLIAWNFGLILQWSLPPRPIRDGLVWDGMLTRQFAAPARAVRSLDTLLFRRCELVKNGGC